MSAPATVSGHSVEHLPNGTARVYFAAPILEHADQARLFVDFRPYTIQERLEIGDPIEWLISDVTGIRVIDRSRLMQWYNRLMVGHDPVILGRAADGALAELIEEAIIGFFQTARTRSKPVSAPLPPKERASPTLEN